MSIYNTDKICKIYIEIAIYIKRLIPRNWLAQIWRLRSPKTCSWQARDLAGLMAQYHSKSEGLRTKRANGVVLSKGWQAQDPERVNASL